MESELTGKQLADKHDFFIREFCDIQNVHLEDREQCLKDRRFATIAGAQWEDLNDQFANRPKFEINKVHLSIIRIFNEYRNNRITVDFVSRDGSKADDLADFCDGLYRSNEQDSNAQEAYDNAFEESVSGGIGAWRYCAKYVDEGDPEDERQEIAIEPIFDADSCVFFDLGAKRQDKSDATRCYVIESMSHYQFEDEFGYDLTKDMIPPDVNQLIDESKYDWVSDDSIKVAEVYEVEEKKEKLHIYKLVDGTEYKVYDQDLKDEKGYLSATGARKIKTRSIKIKCVHKYIMSGAEILEDCGYIAGDLIPIVMTFGKRWFINNVERCMGHVRLAKDAQRLKNMEISALADLSNTGFLEKPIFTPEQILGHEDRWANDNIAKYSYMLLNPIEDSDGNALPSGPVGYTKPPAIPPAMAALLQLTESDIQDVLGNQQDGEMVAGNVSTETAMLVQNRLDMQTYIYMSNFARAMQQGGRIWLGMAKEIYIEKGRVVKAINTQNEVSQKVIKRPKLDSKGQKYLANDLSRAKMDVVSSVGPSSSTAKQSAIKNLTNMLGVIADPIDQKVLSSAILMHSEGEGTSDIKRYFRKQLLRMGVVEPTEDEREELAQEMQNQQPSPQDEYFLAEAERSKAQAVESQADVILKQAKADETQAKTAKTLSEIDAQQQAQAFEAMEKLGPSVNPPQVTGSPIQDL